jgi:hypothetical protein
LWIGDSKQFDEYLIVEVSPRRLESVRVGEIELRAAFVEAEDGKVTKLQISRDADVTKTEILSVASLNAKLLPAPGEVLRLPPAPTLLKAPTHAAVALKREILRDETREMWDGNDPDLWRKALHRYWDFVKPANLALEKEMNQLDAETVRIMNSQAWYRFLLEKYFRWQYTAPNRYVSTTKRLRSYALNNELPALHAIKQQLFALDKDNIQQCLALASSIRGLGIAGASGLLAVLFPAYFGTVSQFAVKALAEIPELPERDLIAAMKPESLKLNEGTIVIGIMRRKAAELNRAFSTTEWTPRKVDMVLWTYAR